MEYVANERDFKFKNTAITLGKFDGLHLGHQLLINKVLEQKKNGLQAAVFTFLMHPNSLFFKKEVEVLYVEDEKRHVIEQMGVDVMISYPFDNETASMEAEDFIKEVLVDRLDAKVLVVGSDFGFGHKRRGNVQMLQDKASEYGYEVIVFDKKEIEGHEISSTFIRDELDAGNMDTVAEFLGRPYSIIGTVEHGRKIGRTLGFPTTNITPISTKLLPKSGVYVSKTIIEGKSYNGLTNIGNNPTVGETKDKKVETYIFDFDEDCYGKTIEVQLLTFEREEVKFDSVDDMKVQIEKDIVFGKEYFSKNK